MEAEVSVEHTIKERKERLIKWAKDNWIFLSILILAIIIRIYYFNLTKTQPLWWDEADYMAYAKNLAGYNVNWIATSPHNSLYSYIVAAFFKIRLSEVVIKFILEFLPSVLLVVIIYKLCILMYNNKTIALVSTFLMATFWEVLFQSMRFHVDVPGLLVGLLSIYIFWQGYEKGEKIFGKINPKWTIPLTVFLVVLTYSIRRGYFIFGVFFLVFMLTTRNWMTLIKDKYNWIGLVGGLILFLIVDQFIFAEDIGGVAPIYTSQLTESLNFAPLKNIEIYFANMAKPWASTLLYLFWIGFVLLIINIFLHYEYLRKLKGSEARADYFVLITIIFTFIFIIGILRLRDPGDARWYYTLLLGAFICISKATNTLSNFVKKYNKHVSIAVIMILIGYGGYYELKQADATIKNKIGSFEGIKQASLFVKENSNPSDLIISVPVPQTIYYSERKTINPTDWAPWREDTDAILHFNIILDKIKQTPEARYLFVSFSEPNHPLWMKNFQVNQQGQITAWEIPFMDTKIDSVTGTQDIKQEKSYDGIIFRLVSIKQDVFIYEIVRNSSASTSTNLFKN